MSEDSLNQTATRLQTAIFGISAHPGMHLSSQSDVLRKRAAFPPLNLLALLACNAQRHLRSTSTRGDHGTGRLRG